MPTYAQKNTPFAREIVAPGNYFARCFMMVHIGTITDFKGKEINKIRIGWEIPTELKTLGNGNQVPFTVSKEFTLSMNEKSHLRKFLVSWRGREFTDADIESFDVAKIIGTTCMLNIIHKQSNKDSTIYYTDIAGVSPIPKGFTPLEPINPVLLFEHANINQQAVDALPEWLKTKVMQSSEYKSFAIKQSIR